MLKRSTAALMLVGLLVGPAVVRAAGPPDRDLAQTVVDTIYDHACNAANMVAQVFGLPLEACKK